MSIWVSVLIGFTVCSGKLILSSLVVAKFHLSGIVACADAAEELFLDLGLGLHGGSASTNELLQLGCDTDDLGSLVLGCGESLDKKVVLESDVASRKRNHVDHTCWHMRSQSLEVLSLAHVIVDLVFHL